MFDFGNIDSRHILPLFPAFTSADRMKNVYTATARVGYLFAPQLLGYVKGGGAWTRTVGGCLEWMFAPSWSVFAEYNYMDFGRKSISYVPGPLVAPEVSATSSPPV